MKIKSSSECEVGLKMHYLVNIRLFLKALLLICLVMKPSFADVKMKIEDLLDDLEVTSSSLEASRIRAEIWRYWVKDHTYEKNNDLIASGLSHFYRGNYQKADQIFTKIILSDPNYVEGWNKRATIRYLLGDFQKSLEDINQVLTRQPRHFGAISGTALIHMQNLRYKKALDSYRLLERIDPNNDDSKRMIPMLEARIYGESL
tara:strand:+ start:84 stop:692 length:609 start_codon:yes stop_codon:yes gene_type:complete